MHQLILPKKTTIMNTSISAGHTPLTPTYTCNISYLDEITNNNECSTIKLKIIHIWKTTTTLRNGSSKGENINMLLMDEKVMSNCLRFKFYLYALYNFYITILSFFV